MAAPLVQPRARSPSPSTSTVQKLRDLGYRAGNLESMREMGGPKPPLGGKTGVGVLGSEPEAAKTQLESGHSQGT